MATDLTQKQGSGEIKLVGADLNGVEGNYYGSTGLDTSNSSVAALAASGTFTGAFINVEQYSNLTVQIVSNVASATLGLVVEYSNDGATVNDSDSYTIPAANGQTYSFGLACKFYRVRYVNGATLQTSFMLQSKLHLGRPKPSTHRIAETVTDEHDAELVKSSLNARDPATGLTGPVKKTSNDDLATVDLCDAGGVQGVIAVGTTPVAVRVGAGNLANRKRLLFINTGAVNLYWGFSNTVSSANGVLVFRNQPVSDSWGPNTTIWIVAASGSGSFTVAESA